MEIHIEVIEDKQGRGWGEKLFLTVFGLAFVAVGGFFTYKMLGEVFDNARTRVWSKAECEIISGTVEKNNEGYYFEVLYRYHFRSSEFEGKEYSLNYKGSDDYGEAQRLALRYPPGSVAPCYVDPKKPGHAVLVHEPLWNGIFALFPLLFIAVGLWVLASGWYPGRKSDTVLKVKSISENGKPKFGIHWFETLICGVFVIIGLAIFIITSATPLYKSLDVLNWERTPCIVQVSEVTRTRDSDGDVSYRPNILYAYKVNDVEYKSNRYSYTSVASSDLSLSKTIVSQYPVGVEKYCYVNFDEPTEAVLNRDFTPRYLLHLLPLAFVAMGLIGIAVFWKSARKRRQLMPSGMEFGHILGTSAALPVGARSPMGEQHSAVTLKPHTLTWSQIGALIFMALFWNGLVSVFVWKAVLSWSEGKPDYFLTVFNIPFVLVGLGFLVGVGYMILKWFNPRVTLVMSQPAVRLGESFNLTWRIPRARAIDHVEITVQGREEAQYTRGTDTHTDKEVFLTIPILSSSFETDMVGGSQPITIPSDSVPSFKADNNKIIWAIHVEGSMKRWLDINDEYEIPVLPLGHTTIG